MITKFLESLEDPKRRLLGPTIWMLSKTGLILPENKYHKAAYAIAIAIIISFVVAEYVEIYIIREDLGLVMENIKVSAISITVVIRVITFTYWQNRWKQLLEYVTKSDEHERVHQDETRGKIIDGYTKYCRRVTNYIWVLTFGVIITISVTPALKYLSSQSLREGLKNGTEKFPHVFSSWVPFDKYHSPGCWLTVFYHVLVCIYGCLLLAAYDTSVIVILSFIGGKFELLKERSKQMLGTPGEVISEDEAARTVRQLQMDHILLLK